MKKIKQLAAALALISTASVSHATTIVSLDSLSGGTITDLNLSVEFESGNFASNLDIVLEHDGTMVHVFMATNEDCSDAFDAIFDDESLNGTAPNCGDVLGDFVPDEPLFAFDGMDLLGTWNLIMWDDVVPGDGTELLGWSIFGETTAGSFLIEGPGATDVDTPRVPEPDLLLLYGLGLIALGLSRRRDPERV